MAGCAAVAGADVAPLCELCKEYECSASQLQTILEHMLDVVYDLRSLPSGKAQRRQLAQVRQLCPELEALVRSNGSPLVAAMLAEIQLELDV